MNAELAYDAAVPADFPTDGLPEVAVLGRSNVGKSTFINALLGRRKLARTSSTPGKTRRIHFYRIERSAYLVDLPGYGYAQIARSERRAWKPMVEGYLRGDREALRGALLLVDVRRELASAERELLAWLEAEQVPAGLVLMKADKLARTRADARARALERELGFGAGAIAAASGKTGRGIPSVAAWLEDWLELRLLRADGTPWVSAAKEPGRGGSPPQGPDASRE